MRFLITIVLLAQLASDGLAQSAATTPSSTLSDNAWHVTLTVFRNPATGIQVGRGHFAAFVGHYPTIIKRDGKQRDTHFVRMGVVAYGSDARTTPYVSLSFASSLTKGWSNSTLVDAGLRQRFTPRFSGQLGAAVLYAPSSGETRVNPTIGLGARF